MWLWLATVALADPCADPAVELQAAVTAFEDAEVELAAERLDQADAALRCMPAPVDPELLEDLYGFGAVVAYALGDQRGTVSSLMRLRTAFPDAEPHPMFGPELSDLSDTWAERVGRPAVRVVVLEGDEVWIDGTALAAGEEARVVAGDHLIQGRTTSGFAGVRQPIASAAGISVGQSITLGVPPPASATEDPGFEPDPPSRGRKRRYRGGLIATSTVALAAGGASLGYAYSREVRFHDDPYDAESFGGCTVGDACYADARVDAIRADALNVRILYIAGYAATGIGAGLLGTELFILPAPTADGVTIGWSGRF